MMINLKELSQAELMSLENAIKEEKQSRGTNTKDSLSSCALFFHALDPNEKSNVASNISWKMNRDVIELCDFALRNYEIRTTQKGRIKRDKVVRNTNHIYKVDISIYKQMVEDLRDVIVKYVVPIEEKMVG